MKKALKEAIKIWQKAGMHYIKVELEGDLNRPQSSSGESAAPCSACVGRGIIECLNCDSLGVRDNQECSSCTGNGYTRCANCSGTGRLRTNGNFGNNTVCKQFILDKLSAEDAAKIVYSKFYRDGSVDSEYTFTVAITDVLVVLDVIRAWNELARLINPNNPVGGNVKGAGMHVSALPSGNYPCARGALNQTKYLNFERQVTKLLPALFFVASSDHQCRSFQYRYPQVSSGSKYSAIYAHGRSCLEYRVFETCYKNPEIFLDYVQVIAQTLKYYIDPNLKVKPLDLTFAFVNRNNSIGEMFTTTEQLQILNAQIKHLKPGDKSFSKLKEERGMAGRTIRVLKQRQSKLSARLAGDYQRYKESTVEWNMRNAGYARRELMTFDDYVRQNIMASASHVIKV